MTAELEIRSTRFRCAVCGKLTAGRKPRGGDGTLMYPSAHKKAHGGVVECPGMSEEAEWVGVVVGLRGRILRTLE